MKTSDKLKRLCIDEEKDIRFYYIQGFGPSCVVGGRTTTCIIKGRITICLIKSTYPWPAPHPLYARGIAVCSPRDQFVKKMGRTIALGRAVKALENRYSSDPIESHLGKILTYQYDALLSPEEAALFAPKTLTDPRD